MRRKGVHPTLKESRRSAGSGGWCPLARLFLSNFHAVIKIVVPIPHGVLIFVDLRSWFCEAAVAKLNAVRHAVVAIAAIAMLASSCDGDDPVATPSPVTHTLYGVIGPVVSLCGSLPGEDLLVRDGYGGTIIGKTAIAEGKQERGHCSFAFVVTGLPDSDVYTLETLGMNGCRLTAAKLEQDEWHIKTDFNLSQEPPDYGIMGGAQPPLPKCRAALPPE